MIRVIIIDRHEIFRIGLSKILNDEPEIEVVGIYSDTRECLRHMQQLKPDIILLDTDFREPGYYEAIPKIYKSHPRLKVIMLTHSDRERDVYNAIKAGAKGYVSKNVAIEELVKTISLIAKGKVVFSSPVATKILEEFMQSYPERGYSRRSRSELTKREEEVLTLVAEGASNQMIALSLHITENTVKVHLRNIMEKLQVSNRFQAAARMLEEEALERAG